MAKKTLTLSEEQKKFLRANYDKKSLLELTREAWGNDKLDGRSMEGHTVKVFLASLGKKVKTTARKRAKKIVLTDEQKEFIDNNAGPDNSSLDLARTLFNNDKLTPLNAESRAVQEYIRENISQTYVSDEEEVVTSNYFPPKAISKLIKLINECAGTEYKEDKITGIQRTEILALGKFLAFPLFIHKMNNFKTIEKRKIFESTFVSYVYNKPDLSVEEVNQYIALSEEHVIESDLNSQIEMINNRFANSKNDNDYTMKLVEMLKTFTAKRDSCVTRQGRLYKSLVEDRSKKKDNSMSENMALTQWFQIWCNEEERKAIIKEAERRKSLIKDEVERLASFDSSLAKIAGLGYVELE